MPACLDTLLIGLYVLADDLLEPRKGAGRRPKLTDAEPAVLAFARWRLGHLFPYLPEHPGYNKRVRALAPQIERLLKIIAFESPSFGDALWLLDGTPVPCGASRETARRSELAGYAASGYCRSQHRRVPPAQGVHQAGHHQP